MVKTAASHAVNIGSNPVWVTKLVLIRTRVHPFPSRTRKLSSLLPTILVWRRTGKIGSANTKEESQVTFLFFFVPDEDCWRRKFVFVADCD